MYEEIEVDEIFIEQQYDPQNSAFWMDEKGRTKEEVQAEKRAERKAKQEQEQGQPQKGKKPKANKARKDTLWMLYNRGKDKEVRQALYERYLLESQMG